MIETITRAITSVQQGTGGWSAGTGEWIWNAGGTGEWIWNSVATGVSWLGAIWQWL